MTVNDVNDVNDAKCAEITITITNRMQNVLEMTLCEMISLFDDL